MNGKLTRVTIGEKAGPMRTEGTTCLFEGVPTVGERFTVIGPPINDHSSARMVSTSPVAEIIEENELHVTFKTDSGSVYRLDIEPEVKS
jgi:hypothetical protein